MNSFLNCLINFQLEMLSEKYVIQEDVKFGSFLPKFSPPGNLKCDLSECSVLSPPSILLNLYRDEIVVMSVSLGHLQHQTGLLADEGLAGDV